MVTFQAPSTYDRVLSVEMFEHMKNYEVLLNRISGWLRPGGMLFVHIFLHRRFPYHFEVNGETDWMAKYFFSGGTMPSLDLLLYFQVPRRSAVYLAYAKTNLCSSSGACSLINGMTCSSSGKSVYDSLSGLSIHIMQNDLAIQNQWYVNGQHYSKTLEVR